MVQVAGPNAAPTGTDFSNLVASQIGTPYVWGGDAPGGFDCSGLVYWAAQQLGIRGFPRTSEEQFAAVQQIDGKQLQPGDLIFMNFPGEVSPGHVVIYAGGDEIIQAPSTGQLVQRDKWSSAAAMGAQIVGYGRIPGLNYAGEPITKGPGGGAVQARTNPNQGGNLGGLVSSILGNLAIPGLGGLAGLLASGSDIAQAIIGVAAPLVKFAEAIDWFLHPAHWIRIFAGIAGAILVLFGIWQMSHTGMGGSY